MQDVLRSAEECKVKVGFWRGICNFDLGVQCTVCFCFVQDKVTPVVGMRQSDTCSEKLTDLNRRSAPMWCLEIMV